MKAGFHLIEKWGVKSSLVGTLEPHDKVFWCASAEYERLGQGLWRVKDARQRFMVPKISWNPLAAAIVLCIGFVLSTASQSLVPLDDASSWNRAVLDPGLVAAINELAPRYFNDEKWNMTIDQYKAYIAALALSEGGRGGYAAHSRWNPGRDVFSHKDARDSFRFATGIGPFQIDNWQSCSCHGKTWERYDRWSTLKKLQYREALESVLCWHYQKFKDKEKVTLQDLWNETSQVWFGVRSDWFGIHFQNVFSGVSWDQAKDKKIEDVKFNPPVASSDRWGESVVYLGKLQWNLPHVNGLRDTYLVIPRNDQGQVFTVGGYYLAESENWEAWVWNDVWTNEKQPLTYYFERNIKRECTDKDGYPTPNPCSQYPERNQDGTYGQRTNGEPALNAFFLSIAWDDGATPSRQIYEVGDVQGRYIMLNTRGQQVHLYMSVTTPQGKQYWVHLRDCEYPKQCAFDPSAHFVSEEKPLTAKPIKGEGTWHWSTYIFREGDEGGWSWRVEMRAVDISGHPVVARAEASYVVKGLRELDMVEQGLRWLRRNQRADGSWGTARGSTGITALVLLAFFNAMITADDTVDTDMDGTPDIAEGLRFLLSNYDPSTGAFTEPPGAANPYATYNTALGILALVASDKSGTRWKDQVGKAMEYLLRIQHQADPNDWKYGGWGYPDPGRPDLSNTQWVVMALDAAYNYLGLGSVEGSEWRERLLVFLQRCQNPDGGFAYQPGGASWGSMTAAGLWCLLLAGVKNTDQRVVAVQDWLAKNYSVRENKGRGQAGLFYYYATLAKALTMAGWRSLPGPDGQIHDWRVDLKAQLDELKRTDSNGIYWVNSDPAVWEGDAHLCTAYALLALLTWELPRWEQFSWVITLHSPGELHVYDAIGRHIGVDENTGWVEVEIPGGNFRVGAQGEQVITLRLFEGGWYRLEIVGTASGTYVLESQVVQGASTVAASQWTGQLTPGRVLATEATITSLAGGVTIFMRSPEPVPSGLWAEPGNGTVKLSWDRFDAPGFTLVGYHIYRTLTSRFGYTKITSVPVRTEAYTDSGLTNGVTYYYVVTAVSADGAETLFSREVSAIPMANRPPQVWIVRPRPGETVTGRTYEIRWEATDPDDPSESLYIDIEISRDSGKNWVSLATREPNDGSYDWDLRSLTGGASYVLRVRATDPKGAVGLASSGPFVVSVFSGSLVIAPNPVGAEGAVFYLALPPDARTAKLLLFNIEGRLVTEITLDPAAARYPPTGRWKPVDRYDRPIANGPYIYVLLVDGKVIEQGKMVIQR